MKKALKIIGIIVLLIFAALIIIPFAFKGKIIEMVKTEANKNLRATVDFSDVDLSLIRNFPNLSVKIENLSVIGVEQFQGDTLAYMDNLGLTIDIMSVIRGNEIEIKKINLDNPYVHVKVLADGTANYDIAIESEEAEADTVDAGGESAALNISEYSINNGRIVYDDASLAMIMVMDGLNHTGKGDFSEEIFTLYTNSEIETLDVVYEGVKYLRRAKVDLKADLEMDMANMKFTFMENELDINDLALHFNGWLAMPADDIDMDITFNLVRTELTSILSLVPADFTQDLEGVTANGSVKLEGYVRGVYNENSMPGYALDFAVDNGSVQYPDLPRSIENIQIAAQIVSPEGDDMDLMTIDVPKFHMEIGKTPNNPNTVDATLSLRRPMTDPLIKTRVDADLDFGTFKDVIPMEEDFNLAGLLSAHFSLDGALSAIESQQFDNFKADGGADLTNMAYSDAEMSVQVPEARVTFSPQRMDLQTLKVIYDEINMSMDGYVNNYVAYALTDTMLQGVFNFAADRIDANKYMSSDSTAVEETPTDTAAAGSGEIFEVPDNLDIILNATIGEILYDNIVLKNIKGQIGIQNEIASLNNMVFETLDGTIQMDGSYNTQNAAKPVMDFSYDIRDIDLRKSAETFVTIEKMAPIAKHASGKISSTMTLRTELDQNMDPITETMQGRGTLSSENIVLEGGKFLEKLSTTLKSPKLARQEIQDLNLSFVIADGQIVTEPFDVKIDKMTANVSGYSSFDETIDYLMKMKIPRGELGGDFNKMAEGLLSQANAFLGGNMSMGENIKVDVRIHGDLYDPTITPSFAGMEGGSVKDQAKEAVKEAITEKVEEVKDKAREEADKQAQKILADAQKQADRVKQEAASAAQKIRDEGEKQAQNIMDEANNPLQRAGAKIAADKVKDEANKRANQVQSEGKNQADDIMAKARAEADKLK